MSPEEWAAFSEYCRSLELKKSVGRASLRRRWTNLRLLSSEVITEIPDDVVARLLGKTKAQLDPEQNDLKALVAYAVGQGRIAPESLKDALAADDHASPLHWLATLSGKTFGENVVPQLCAYWLLRGDDTWQKQPGTAYFDIAWHPTELDRAVRMELKASSEAPGFRFQQVRDPRHTGAVELDYDLLLCLGVTAESLEFWSIPATVVADEIDKGVFKNQHGGKKMVSNQFWFQTDPAKRRRFDGYRADATSIRDCVIRQFS